MSKAEKVIEKLVPYKSSKDAKKDLNMSEQIVEAMMYRSPSAEAKDIAEVQASVALELGLSMDDFAQKLEDGTFTDKDALKIGEALAMGYANGKFDLPGTLPWES